MPTVANAARVTCKDGAVWRVCASCGLLAAYAPEVYHCDDCQAQPVPEFTALAADLRAAVSRSRDRGRS